MMSPLHLREHLRKGGVLALGATPNSGKGWDRSRGSVWGQMESNEADLARDEQAMVIMKAYAEEEKNPWEPDISRENSGPSSTPIVFCCFHARRHWCRFGAPCKFLHGVHQLHEEDRKALREGRKHMICDRMAKRGECYHKELGEHV